MYRLILIRRLLIRNTIHNICWDFDRIKIVDFTQVSAFLLMKYKIPVNFSIILLISACFISNDVHHHHQNQFFCNWKRSSLLYSGRLDSNFSRALISSSHSLSFHFVNSFSNTAN
ncbi:hypothetical protein NH340_JMT08787 [Sarcoptes scabiei]|nr:hypothetical protein NH340_JMT08787 [Sarcoptes scabiei]